MMCLRLRLRLFHWTGMFLVVLGLVIVGVADILYANDTAEKSRVSIITGMRTFHIFNVLFSFYNAADFQQSLIFIFVFLQRLCCSVFFKIKTLVNCFQVNQNIHR